MIELRAAADVIRARLAARDLVRQAGLGVMDQTRFATAVSELGRHALGRTFGARFDLVDLSDARVHRLQARLSENGHAGPRGQDAEAPGVRQLVDVFEIGLSAEATHVTVQIVRLRKQPR